MSERIVVDPVTRIEGHLRIEAAMADGRIESAYSSGTMVRGIENILKGRDPRDAWAYTQRICGVCTLVHGIASVRAVEDALHYSIPDNARLIRNLMIGAQFIHDHVMHFYHLHALDWVDVVSALDAEPEETSRIARSLSNYPKSSPGYFSDIKKKLKAFVDGGQLGIFANGYWGHPAYRLPPEINLLAVAHYLDALAWQREVVQLHTIFGGKNPHPNFLVGGVPNPIDLDSDSAINAKRLGEVKQIIERMIGFVDQVLLPDVIAIAGAYREWFSLGEGLGNFLTYGEFPGSAAESLGIPSGVILNRDLGRIHPVNLEQRDEIQEFVDHSWYAYSGGEPGLHPYDGETRFAYDGPPAPFEQLNIDGGYSWLKSPRWHGKAMEVGPLARVLMLYAQGDPDTRELVDGTLKTLDLPVDALYSTLGRTAARALETQLIARWMTGWYDDLVANIRAGKTQTHNPALWEPASWPGEARGVGFTEAPRGALAHWIVIHDQKILNYQAVVPSTWNAGPRDSKGQAGAYEAALASTPVVDTAQPLEILRTIHSFDPCIACAVHLLDTQGEEVNRIQIV